MPSAAASAATPTRNRVRRAGWRVRAGHRPIPPDSAPGSRPPPHGVEAAHAVPTRQPASEQDCHPWRSRPTPGAKRHRARLTRGPQPRYRRTVPSDRARARAHRFPRNCAGCSGPRSSRRVALSPRCRACIAIRSSPSSPCTTITVRALVRSVCQWQWHSTGTPGATSIRRSSGGGRSKSPPDQEARDRLHNARPGSSGADKDVVGSGVCGGATL